MTSTRIPQEERTRLMRQRLLEATIACLIEYGWTGTTTTVVSERAGVSRGAQVHHFPTRSELVTAAVEHLAQVRTAALTETADSLAGDDLDPASVLAILSDYFISDMFTAALELWNVARTDPQLLALVAPLEREVGSRLHHLTVQMLRVDENLPGNRELIQGTLDMLRGLALADTISDDSARRSKILGRWAVALDTGLDRSGPAADDPLEN